MSVQETDTSIYISDKTTQSGSIYKVMINRILHKLIKNQHNNIVQVVPISSNNVYIQRSIDNLPN